LEKKTHLQKYYAKKLFGKNPLQKTYFAKIPWKKNFLKKPLAKK